MKIAIHHREGSFSDSWISYCKENNIKYGIVNAYDSDIITQLEGYDAFLWHHHHGKYQDVLFAKQLLASLQTGGKKIYPDYQTTWHFDDKVGQKYLLESIGTPLVPSYVFYDKESAMKWAKTTTFPKVFKLRGGAGAVNVKLVKNLRGCIRVINKAFSSGFSPYNRLNSLKDAYRIFKKTKNPLALFKVLGKLVVTPKGLKMLGTQKGYVYFQDFIPNNNYDIRLIVIGGQYVYGMKRMNRDNDFRASGSSSFDYGNIPIDAVKLVLETAQRLKLQSAAFDIIYANKQPLIIELSYGFGTKGSSQCPGYWDKDLKWHEERFNPMDWIIGNVLKD